MLPEPPDGTILEFENHTDVYAVRRSDASSVAAGWTSGDGGEVWCLYGSTIPCTWERLVADFGEENLARAVRLLRHPDDIANRDQWPTAIMARERVTGARRTRRPRTARTAQ